MTPEAFVRKYQLTEKRLQSFWSKIDIGDNADCWLWRGLCNHNGYGTFSIGNSRSKIRFVLRAHRIVFGLVYGEEPECVCHSCDNPQCVNPHHLFAGTHKINTQDMMRKSRHVSVYGVKRPGSKLTDEKVTELRKLYESGATYSELAEAFGISKHSVQTIARGIHWKHVPYRVDISKRREATRTRRKELIAKTGGIRHLKFSLT